MRTALFLVAGFLLMGGFLLIGKLFGEQLPSSARIATFLFVTVWVVIAGANMWLGVARAGYSAAEELPIFLLVFAPPAIVAAIVNWRLL